MGFGYGESERWHDQYFGRELTVDTTGIETDALVVGSHQGALCVSVDAVDGVTCSDLCMCIMESDTEDSEFTEKEDGPTVMISGTFGERQNLMKLALPNCKRLVKIHLEAKSCTGTVDVYLSYLAR